MIYLLFKNIVYFVFGALFLGQYLELMSFPILANVMDVIPFEGLEMIPVCLLLILGMDEILLYFVRNRLPDDRVRKMLFFYLTGFEAILAAGSVYWLACAIQLNEMKAAYFIAGLSLLMIGALFFKIALKNKIISVNNDTINVIES